MGNVVAQRKHSIVRYTVVSARELIPLRLWESSIVRSELLWYFQIFPVANNLRGCKPDGLARKTENSLCEWEVGPPKCSICTIMILVGNRLWQLGKFFL